MCCRQKLLRPGDSGGSTRRSGADWVAPVARRGSSIALYAVATSADDRYLAAGGGDKIVHVWDLRSNEYIKVCVCFRGCEPSLLWEPYEKFSDGYNFRYGAVVPFE